jgi:S-adenosylmethionine hydrolase
MMKGVIAIRAPGAQVVDLSHGIPPQNVLAGALVLRAAAAYFPEGTIHLGVVDPGVGTARRAICIETDRACFVGPDNGLLSLAAPAEQAIRIVEITNERYMLVPRSHTFHGRDVFAPAAAALATGVTPGALGPERSAFVRIAVPTPVREGRTIRGEVVYVDGFGNLATNIESGTLPDVVDRVEVAGRTTTGVVATYAAARTGALLALVNSWGVVEIAVRDGDARASLDGRVGLPVTVVGT